MPLERRAGLPIGNLTSQFFANVYLSGFDHFVKERLHIRNYLRYVDDFLLFADDQQQLAEAKVAIAGYLQSLRLQLHPIKSQLFETCVGLNFVGFRILPKGTGFPKDVCIRVRNDNLRRSRLRLKQLQQDYATGQIDLSALVQRLQSWEAHLMHGDTHRLRRHVFDATVFQKNQIASAGSSKSCAKEKEA